MSPSRTLLRGIPTGVGCAVIALLFALTSAGKALDDWFTDLCFVFRGPRHTTAKVVIISVDEQSLDSLKKPLAYVSPELARVIRYAAQQGVEAIGLDVFIPQSLGGLTEIATSGGIGEARSLGTAVVQTKKVVLPQVHDPATGRLRRPLPQWSALLAAAPQRTDFGLLNLTEDADQFVRRQALVDRPETTDPLPCFALALYARSRQTDFAVEAGGRAVRAGDVRIPLDADRRMRINFAGPAGTFPVIPLFRLLEAEREGLATPELRGAVAIVGVSGRVYQDLHPTPYASGAARLFALSATGLFGGAEVHAHALATIQDQAFLSRPWWVEPLPWVLLVGAALAAALARVNLTLGATLVALALTGSTILSYSAFRYFGWILSPVPVALASTLTFAVVLARRRWRLRHMFAVSRSEALVRALEASPRRLDPLGQIREVTALCADIRGFKSFSEKCRKDPRRVVAVLNAYFEKVVPVIEAQGGTVVSLVGDGVLVLFGFPVAQADHAIRAVRTAIRIAWLVHENAARWCELGFPGMRIGVGVHTGPVVVGAVGVRRRVDYTAIGEAISLCSSVERQTKALEADVLITASTRSALASDPQLASRCRDLADPVVLDGKNEPVQLSDVTIVP